MALAKSQESLKNWGKQNWRTKSGKPSSKTGERYLPSAAIKSLSEQSLVAPYKLMGELALSVDKAITFFTLFFKLDSIKF